MGVKDKFRKSSKYSLWASLFQALFHIVMIIVGSLSKGSTTDEGLSGMTQTTPAPNEESDCHGTFLQAFGSILLIMDIFNIGVQIWQHPMCAVEKVKGRDKEFRCTHCDRSLYVGPDSYKNGRFETWEA